MKFTLVMECDGQAFVGDDDTDPGPEISRILTEVAARVDAGEDGPGNGGLLHDFNGNAVGRWDLFEQPDA